MPDHIDRRGFLKGVGTLGAGLTLGRQSIAAQAPAGTAGRVLGANDRINVAVVGCGGRGSYDADKFAKFGNEHNNACQIVAVCDVYEKRKHESADRHQCKGFLDYREVVSRPDVDAVIVATPDHWHAAVALAAMTSGKDVYLEKPMCHTTDEVKQLLETTRATGRVVQVGSQTTSADQWWKAKKAIADGMIGKLIMSQGSYHRNSLEGEWNWPMDANAGPSGKGDNYVDWSTWLGSAPKRDWDPDRFFRFRKYWDYSGGIATDLFFHVIAPLNICWPAPQYPSQVMASGGIYAFPDREVPDTFHLIAEYPEGHSLVLSSSMANRQHIPGLIRGHEGTLIMVEHGEFERYSEYLTVKPELIDISEKEQDRPFPNYKFGPKEIRIPVEQSDMMELHIENFLDCMRTRKKPHLDVETAAHAQIVINLAVESYREKKVKFWDEKNWRSSDSPVTA